MNRKESSSSIFATESLLNVQVQGCILFVFHFLQREMISLLINGLLFIISIHLTSSSSSTTNNYHPPPQVYEELQESLYRAPRHSDHSSSQPSNFLPPIFTYDPTAQQDRLKEKYLKQQNSNFKSFKMFPTNYDEVNEPINTNRRNSDDWQPILRPFYPSKLSDARLRMNILQDVEQNMKLNREEVEDLDGKDSQIVEKIVSKTTASIHNKDPNVILIEPKRLQKNFGLEPKIVDDILKNASPQTLTNNLEIADLKDLLGKEPTYQLEGLNKLLKENKLPTSVEIKHNGSPSMQINNEEFHSLQEQVDALNKARTDALLSAAQQQAAAHIKAQHDAITKLQKNAAKEAYAKIAAHNNGITILEANGQPITPAPIIVPVPKNYISSTTRRPNLHPKEDCTDQQLNLKENLAASNHVIDVQLPPQYIDQSDAGVQEEQEELERPTDEEQEEDRPQIEQNYSAIPVPHIQQITSDHIDYITQQPEPSKEERINHLYYKKNENEHDYPQYATKYAFGYHIMDEASHNDFGHEEKRDGKLTKGHYFAHLPDGRIQKVDYFVDDHGYHAKVTYDHIATHPYNHQRKPETEEEISDHHEHS